MPKSNILYLSTNNIWGGSEVLWTESARQFAGRGHVIKAGINFEYEQVKNVIQSDQYIDLKTRIINPSLPLRIMRKLGFRKLVTKDLLHEHFKQFKPDLVIISQGNNIDGRKLMEDCVRFNIPFVTITQLVSEIFWPSLDDSIIDELRNLYRKAACNYFVSVSTLSLHEKILGEKLDNAIVVYNPFIKSIPNNNLFPLVQNGIYKVALIGRLETFHKGYDLLIDVLKNDKWKNRPIHFSLYGKGPHLGLLKRLVKQNNITNISFHGHVDDAKEIWNVHHLLLMPSRIEGQSLSLIESMRFNRAAVVTNVGGATELIEDGLNGFVAAYPAPEFIDCALERAWERRSEWELLGLNAGKTIREKHPIDTISFFNHEIETIMNKRVKE